MVVAPSIWKTLRATAECRLYRSYQKFQMSLPTELQLPACYWNLLSQDDKTEYLRLRQGFHHGQKISSKDRRIVTFRKELDSVLRFLERSSENKEARCVLTGVCFAGRVVCVNTRQLKAFLSRCKSSINGSFQQLGYVALRTKAKARSCVTTVLPSLQNQQNILRQWTCRVVSEDANFCFLSSFSHVQLPEITDDDLFEEKKAPAISQPRKYFQSPIALPMTAPQRCVSFDAVSSTSTISLRPKPLECDLLCVSEADSEMSEIDLGPMATSFSMGFATSSDLDVASGFASLDYDPFGDLEKQRKMVKSFSMFDDPIPDMFGDL